MLGFWEKLNRPIFVLAPMADVTDAAFRRIIAEAGKPDVMWTEFVSADGLALAPEAGRKKLLKSLEYSETERPIVAQFFTSSPENMKKAAELAHKLGFDGVDINMGCPDKSIEKQGAGASLMKNITLARELVRAAKEGSGMLPVSVKTRTGYSQPELENWLPEILKEDVSVITIHARSRREMSKVPARWEFVRRAVEIRDASSKETLIFGNGDVVDIDDARRKCDEFGCDGVMLGRAVFGNPWLFTESCPTREEKLRVLVKHAKLFEELLSGYKSFAVMKKHFKSYLLGMAEARNLHTRLMDADNADEVEKIVSDILIS
ncbi:MAG: tRNA-dihydrouridine synthase [bacterium]|nr:tRNA-dihydrouridine synthase [bacterium]